MALKLQINVPVELALTRSDPKVYTHGKNNSYMYSVTFRDGSQDKAFLTESCSRTIAELRIQPREWFTLCRKKTPAGGEYFEVHTSANSTQTNKLPAAAVAPPQQPASQPQPQPKEMGQARSSASSLMSAALVAAIDAASEAEKYAASKGISVEFGPDDLRALAATVYIQACKEKMAA